MSGSNYSLGLHEVGEGCFAYLQPDGGWGYSNAGLVVGDGASLLVDTLFDLKLTAAMLNSMKQATETAPISTVVNTHANGDHCYGNQLVEGANIVASSATAREMTEVPPSMLAALNKAPGEVGDLFRSFFGDFEFEGIDLSLPTQTFDKRLDLNVGGQEVQLIEVGPAHTAGDTIAYVPSTGSVFTGDILFIGGAPIVWAGPLQNWIAACDLIIGLEATVVVPGHGPLTDNVGVREVRDYLSYVLNEATERQEQGMDAFDAAKEICKNMMGDTSKSFAGWKEFGRISVNVDTVYRTLDPQHQSPNVVEQFARMAALEKQH
ncbi:MAG: MBL fold metallo-hydrolase [Actinobacteria bacterium]|nr:MBL fold metallo-hydrolase [Actinomycetota bacterium]MDA2998634.1 MBL fold metallo-hydrolase [Actinomycetota bacterium]